MEEFIQEKQCTIIRKNEKENFVSELMNVIGNISTSSIPDKESLETIVQKYTRIFKFIWYKFSQYVNITKYSKVWWNEKYHDKLTRYRSFKIIEDQKIFKGVIKETKHLFFDNKIQEITSKNKRSWDLMNWVKKASNRSFAI